MGKTAQEYIEWCKRMFNSESKHLDFTKHMITYVKPSNEKLFNEVLDIISKEDHGLKFLSFVGTGD